MESNTSVIRMSYFIQCSVYISIHLSSSVFVFFSAISFRPITFQVVCILILPLIPCTNIPGYTYIMLVLTTVMLCLD